MKILHTSDWHLGKRLMKLDRSEEHQGFLNWLIETIKNESIDVLLIAGDIFDVPNPPHQSLELFFQFLHRLSVETKVLSYIIAGNHDSGVLLEAPRELLRTHRVKIWGKLSETPETHWETVTVQNESFDLCALPFFRSFELLPHGEGDAIAALKTYLERKKTRPTILLFHHLAGIFEAAGSEQVVSLSGVESIPSELLKDFDYVALGHIHKPQKIASNAYYSGSPIPLRFSETLGKNILVITLTDKIEIEKISIPVFRELHLVKATLESWKEKLTSLPAPTGPTPMVEVQLSLPAPQMGLTEEIRDLLQKRGMELLSFIPHYGATETQRKKKENLFDLSPVELFDEFYATKFPDSPGVPEEIRNDFKELLLKVKHASHQD